MVGFGFPRRKRTSISDRLHRAGGHWRSHAPESDPEQQRWDVETYKHWLNVVKKEQQTPESERLLSGLAVSHDAYILNPSFADIESAPQIYIL